MANLAQEEGKKPGLNSSFINIGVHSQEADVVFFRIKRTTQLKKLMNAYCDKRDRDIVYFEFLLNGDRIKGEQTPNETWLDFMTQTSVISGFLLTAGNEGW
ncbi:small ubiquitin-related modifier 1-like isoform X1 [Olea europaea var. sylvestris]|uniref:Rad60/SUMO-like domain-containing protein n=1 Tax=Olea europaea subsp. europaea TaxID=158383 RepID=A0A8S0PPE8_OLEEU|nr:small ubiquitin-related modifier 1-like isoform X1 [Olea europaea var. sylvestris]CAA2956106.1 Hypothetical predicted protein [Olea europaea subsp. europaea]